MSKRAAKGYRVVLTADRTLMADYKVLLDGMLAAAQTTMVPRVVMKTVLAPRLSGCNCAPMGLRRIEAALLAGRFKREEVAIVPPEGLVNAVGDETRIVGISSGDPLGRGMNSTTMRGLTGRRTYTEVWFERLTTRVRSLRQSNSKLRLVMGGPGAWQLAGDEPARRRLGVDHVVLGYCEDEIAGLFGAICDGTEPREVIECTKRTVKPPTILGPALMGVVEISRGCGMGCGFCTMAGEPMIHFPVEAIVEDARVNVRGGMRELSLIGEDVFRYGATRADSVNPQALKELLGRLRGIPGAGRIHVDHANISSLARLSDRDLADVHGLLVGDDDSCYLWVNLGVETLSPRLLAANCRAKIRPHDAEQWPELCLQQVRRLATTGFVPMVSLLMGLPGETEEDVAETLRWVEKLRGEHVTVFPMFLAATGPEMKSFTADDMTRTHWRLLRESYRLNFKWFPRLVWDNQKGAGAPLWRRLTVQGLGRTAIPLAKTMLAWKCGGRRA